MANENTSASEPPRRAAPEGTRPVEPVTTLTVREAAVIAGGRVEGDPEVEILRVAPAEDAGPGELAFLADRKYLEHLSDARAAALLISEELAGEVDFGGARIVVPDARRALADILDRLHPVARDPATIHPTAVVEEGVRLGENVDIGPYAVIGRDARIGDHVRIGPHAVVGARARVGRESVVHAHVTLYPDVEVGARVVLHAGVRLGADGFGWVEVEGRPRKIPQVGGCRIGDDVEIGANSCVDRGSIGDTELGDDVKLDNLVQIGHNARVGNRSLLAAQAALAGSAVLGEGVQMGGKSGVGGHLRVGAGARIGGKTGVIGDVDAGEALLGFPARPQNVFLRATGALYRLPDALRRLRALERRLEALEEGAAD